MPVELQPAARRLPTSFEAPRLEVPAAPVDRLPPALEPGRHALFLDFDGGRTITKERIGAFARSYGITADSPNLIIISMPSPWLRASNPGCMDDLRKRLIRYKAGMLIIDNLLVTAGTTNENDPVMASVMSNWRRLTEECNLATILIHHPNKHREVNRPGDRLRGHGSIEAALDLALYVEWEGTSDNIRISATKVRAAPVEIFSAYFTYKHWPGTKTLMEARMIGLQGEESGLDWEAKQSILKVVSENPGINKTELKEKVHKLLPIGVNRIGDLIDKLDTDGKIRCQISERGAKLYVMA